MITLGVGIASNAFCSTGAAAMVNIIPKKSSEAPSSVISSEALKDKRGTE